MIITFKVCRRIAIVGAVAFFNLSMSWEPGVGILDQQDLELARNQGPTLSSYPGDNEQWESFSEWQCFPIESIEIRYAKYCKPEGCDPQKDYDVPSVAVEYGGHSYQFDYDLGDPDQAQETLQDWENLLRDQTALCIYAAMLPVIAIEPSDPDQSFWSLYNIKTRKGIWRPYDLPYPSSDEPVSEPIL